jgi:hypothetical protein
VASPISVFDYELGGIAHPQPGILNISIPHVHIGLGQWLEGKGELWISPELASESAIDAHIALLKADLDDVAEKAKAALREIHQEAAA